MNNPVWRKIAGGVVTVSVWWQGNEYIVRDKVYDVCKQGKIKIKTKPPQDIATHQVVDFRPWRFGDTGYYDPCPDEKMCNRAGYRAMEHSTVLGYAFQVEDSVFNSIPNIRLPGNLHISVCYPEANEQERIQHAMMGVGQTEPISARVIMATDDDGNPTEEYTIEVERDHSLDEIYEKVKKMGSVSETNVQEIHYTVTSLIGNVVDGQEVPMYRTDLLSNMRAPPAAPTSAALTTTAGQAAAAAPAATPEGEPAVAAAAAATAAATVAGVLSVEEATQAVLAEPQWEGALQAALMGESLDALLADLRAQQAALKGAGAGKGHAGGAWEVVERQKRELKELRESMA
jgi:hypothetical protein